MSTVTRPSTESSPLPAIPTVPIWRFTVEQYHAMGRAGILSADDKVELLAGWIVPKMTKNPPHSGGTRLTRKALQRVLPEGWFIDSQEPVTTDDSEPEPDIAVIRGDEREYLERHPGPTDVGMLVEVADSSIRQDRGLKKSVYALARIPIYWIVNIPERRVEVYTEPTGSGDEADYAQRRDYGVDEQVPVILDGREVARLSVRDLLP